jgi:hypothetical protein
MASPPQSFQTLRAGAVAVSGFTRVCSRQCSGQMAGAEKSGAARTKPARRRPRAALAGDIYMGVDTGEAAQVPYSLFYGQWGAGVLRGLRRGSGVEIMTVVQ